MSEPATPSETPSSSVATSVGALVFWLVGSAVLTTVLVGALVMVLVVTQVDLSHGVPAAQAQIAEIANTAAADVSTLIGPGAMAMFGAVQFAAMLGLAVAIDHVVERRWGGFRWSHFGFTPARRGVWPWAVLGGLTVGFFPGWVAVKLGELFPDLGMGALDSINAGLSDGPLPERLLMAFVIAVVGPAVEEIVFRGFIWDRLQRIVSAPWVWVLSSLIFAGYHMDPIHVIAVSITGLYLGWFRQISGSIWPPIVMHMLNNALGAGQALTGNVDAELAGWVPAVTGVVALGAAIAAHRQSRET